MFFLQPAESRESRKKPASIVASVKRKYEEEDEEEYDPLNPAVGSLASVIHGPTRKYVGLTLYSKLVDIYKEC